MYSFWDQHQEVPKNSTKRMQHQHFEKWAEQNELRCRNSEFSKKRIRKNEFEKTKLLKTNSKIYPENLSKPYIFYHFSFSPFIILPARMRDF